MRWSFTATRASRATITRTYTTFPAFSATATITALEAYHRCVKALRAGATSEDVLDAADVIAERGFTINDGFLHAFGIGLLPPSIGTRESAVRRGPPGPTFRFEENMCVVVQPNVVTHDERAGVQLGNLFRITRDGAECLHRLPLRYFITT